MRPLSSVVAERVKLTAATEREFACFSANRTTPYRSAATVVFPEPGIASIKILGRQLVAALVCSSVSWSRSIALLLRRDISKRYRRRVKKIEQLAHMNRQDGSAGILQCSGHGERELALTTAAHTLMEK